jgi:MFS superfamily sulfate permease-like transporter
VALDQVTGMLGLNAVGHRTVDRVWNDLHHIDQVNVYALTISVSTLLVVVGAKGISKKIPGGFIAVVGAIVLSWAVDLGKHVNVLGMVPRGLPHIALPGISWKWDLIEKLAPSAFSMFVVILAQSAATSRAYATRYREHFSENTDLVGLGLANIGAGLSGTFVVNGSPTKTQMVDSAGGRTQLSLLVTTVVVLMVLLFLTATFAYMPEAVLSAIVFLIGIDLIDLKGMHSVLDQRRSEFWVALITTSTVVLVGVEQGILLAITLSLIDHTRRGYAPKNTVLVPSEAGEWRSHPWSSKVQAAPGLIIYHFAHSMYYANAAVLENEIRDLVDDADPPLRWLCIDASSMDDVDYSAAETVRSLHWILMDKGVRLVIAQVMVDLPAQNSYHLRELFGDDAFYKTLGEVMKDYQQQTRIATMGEH